MRSYLNRIWKSIQHWIEIDGRFIAAAGLLTAISWGAGRDLPAVLVVGNKYNAFGVFLALLVWLFYGMNEILFGAIFVRITGKQEATE